MHDDFSKYELMKNSGASPEQVYVEAARDNLEMITRIRLIRVVFSFTLEQFKETWVRAEGIADSLDEHLENIAQQLERAQHRQPDNEEK